MISNKCIIDTSVPVTMLRLQNVLRKIRFFGNGIPRYVFNIIHIGILFTFSPMEAAKPHCCELLTYVLSHFLSCAVRLG